MNKSAEKHRVDRLLQNIANISQVLLVALAFFGYFYTVRPIYQKELLGEEVARKEIELREQENRLNKIRGEKEILTNENESLNKKNKEIYLINLELNRDKNILDAQINEMKGILSEQKESYLEIKSGLRTNVVKYFREHIKQKLPNVPTHFSYLDFAFDIVNPFASYKWLKNGEPTSEKIITEALEDFEQIKLLDDEDRRKFINCVNSYMQNHLMEMRKSFNLLGLFDEYRKQYEKNRMDVKSGKYKIKIENKTYTKEEFSEDFDKQMTGFEAEMNKEFQGIFEELSLQKKALVSLTFNALDDISEGFINNEDCSTIKN